MSSVGSAKSVQLPAERLRRDVRSSSSCHLPSPPLTLLGVQRHLSRLDLLELSGMGYTWAQGDVDVSQQA